MSNRGLRKDSPPVGCDPTKKDRSTLTDLPNMRGSREQGFSEIAVLSPWSRMGYGRITRALRSGDCPWSFALLCHNDGYSQTEPLGIRSETSTEGDPMEGNAKLLEALNYLLAGELTAINQYIVHAEMCEDWGYGKLSENFKKRSITEMKHAERLIERILFLEGTPIVSNLNAMTIGATVPQQVDNDHAMECDTVKQYNEAIVLAGDVLDYATRDILTEILRDEDRHVDELEELEAQIQQMTLPTFLSTQN